MKKFYVMSFLVVAALAFMSFTQSTHPTNPETELSPLEVDATTLEFLAVDQVLKTETVANENGTYTLTIHAMSEGKKVTNTYEAFGYSPEGNNCNCVDCDTWAPYGNAYKIKVVIGSKCWCLYCDANTPRPR